MGGAIGFRIPLYAPDHFHALVLGGAGYTPHKAIQAYDDLGPAYEAMEQAATAGHDNPMEIFLRIYEEKLGPMSPERKTVTLAQDGMALAAACQASRGEASPEASGYLARFPLPCFIFAGELDPRCPDAKESARQIPGARSLFLPGLTHGQVNAVEPMLGPVERFLAEWSRKSGT